MHVCSDFVVLLQQICDDRRWRDKEDTCVRGLEQAHTSILLAMKDSIISKSRAGGDRSNTMWAVAKQKTQLAVAAARAAAQQEARQERVQLLQTIHSQSEALNARLKQNEEDRADALERARQAEQIIGRSTTKDQAHIAQLETQMKQMRLRSLALQERVEQMKRLHEDDKQTIARLESQLADREKRIAILESKN